MSLRFKTSVLAKQTVQDTYKSFKNEGSFVNNIKYYTLYFIVNFAIQLAFTPIIARIFTAHAYGTFSLVSSLSTYASVFFTLQLDPAIVVQKTETQARNITRSISTIICFSFIVSYIILIAVLGSFQFSSAVFFRENSYFLWVPLLSFFIAAHNVYGHIANRNKKYKRIFWVMSPIYLLSKLSSVSWGKLISNNFFGLFLGEILFRISAVVLGFKVVVQKKILNYFKPLSIAKTYAIAKENSSYVFFEFPLRLISLLSTQMPIYFLAIYYGRNTVGQFAFANAFLEVPVRLVSYSFATVFFQKSSEVINNGGIMLGRSVKMLIGLLLLGAFPFLLLYNYSDQVFGFLFGKQWTLASELAVSLVLFYFSRFVFEPFQVLFRVLRHQRLQFITTSVYFLIFGSYLFFSMKNNGNLFHIFQTMSIMSLFFYFFQTALIFYLLKKQSLSLKN